MNLLSYLKENVTCRDVIDIGVKLNLFLEVLMYMALNDATKRRLCAHFASCPRFWTEFAEAANKSYKNSETKFECLAKLIEKRSPRSTDFEPVLTVEQFAPPMPTGT